MTLYSKTAAALAAAGLVLAQPAAAAARTPAATDDGEGLADAPGAGPALAAIGIVALISLIMLIDDSDSDRPSSP